MDFLKDLSEAWSQRLRSPFIGSIALSFFAINWQPIWYLLFADRPVRQKFLYFDANTSIASLAILPIAIGVVLALASPWLRALGAWWAQGPNSRIKKLQHNAVHRLKLLEISNELARVEAEADLQASRERAIIDAAKRLEEASEVGGQRLTEEIESERRSNETRLPNKIQKVDISESALDFLRTVVRHSSGVFYLSDYQDKYTLSQGDKRFIVPNRRKFLEYKAAIAELREKGLLEKDKDAISERGYEYLSKIAAEINDHEVQA